MTSKLGLPLLSVLIPSFNSARTIDKALISVFSQTYSNLEIVVSDDASSDRTCMLVNRYKDPRMRLFRRTENIGRVANYRTLLLDNCSGEYVVVLDADDYFLDPCFLSKAIDVFLSDSRAVIVSARTLLVGLDGDYVSRTLPPLNSFYEGSRLLLYLPFHGSFFSHSASVYRRSAAASLAPYSFPGRSSDWDLLYRMSLEGNTHFLDIDASAWRFTGSNQSLIFTMPEALLNLSVWKRIYSPLIDCFVPNFFYFSYCFVLGRAFKNDFLLALRTCSFCTALDFSCLTFLRYPLPLLIWSIVCLPYLVLKLIANLLRRRFR